MKVEKIIETGFQQLSLDLSPQWRLLTEKKDYSGLELLLRKDIQENEVLKQLIDETFSLLAIQGRAEIEHMLALRSGPEDEEMEGIWHDDSSRHFAISLSLSLEPEKIEGGELEIRPFGQLEVATSLPGSRPFGQASIFLTGKYGFEHRTRRVTSGNRLVLVLWISSSIPD